MNQKIDNVMIISEDNTTIDDISQKLLEKSIPVLFSGVINALVQNIVSGQTTSAILLDLDTYSTPAITLIKVWTKLIARIKENKHIPPPLIIICSSNNIQSASLFLSIGTYEIIVKPFTSDQLYARILFSIMGNQNSLPIINRRTDENLNTTPLNADRNVIESHLPLHDTSIDTTNNTDNVNNNYISVDNNNNLSNSTDNLFDRTHCSLTGQTNVSSRNNPIDKITDVDTLESKDNYNSPIANTINIHNNIVDTNNFINDPTNFSGSDRLRSEITLYRNNNNALKRQIDDIIWRMLRPNMFNTIPQMRNIAEDDHRLGQYEYLHFLGKGGFGHVRAANNKDTNIKVAIKQISKDRFEDLKDIENVQNEINIMINLNHPNIVRLLSIEHTSKYIYIISEYCGGGNLRYFIKERGNLREEDIKKYFYQILLAIDCCHSRRICHRDIKPENFLFGQDKNIKLIDFGLACKNKPGQFLKDYCGSLGYIAPEILLNEPYDGLVADVYSLGCLLLDLIIGPSNDMRIYQKHESGGIDMIRTKVNDFSNHPHITQYSPHLVEIVRKTVVFDKNLRWPVNKLLKSSFFTSKLLPPANNNLQKPVMVSTSVPIPIQKNKYITPQPLSRPPIYKKR